MMSACDSLASHSRKSSPCLHNNKGANCPKETQTAGADARLIISMIGCRRHAIGLIVACHNVGLLHARILSASVRGLHVHHCEAPRATSKICYVVTQLISKQHCLRLLV